MSVTADKPRHVKGRFVRVCRYTQPSFLAETGVRVCGIQLSLIFPARQVKTNIFSFFCLIIVIVLTKVTARQEKFLTSVILIVVKVFSRLSPYQSPRCVINGAFGTII